MKTLNSITDPIIANPEAESRTDRFLKSFIRDERDLPFVYLTIKITFTLIPLAILLYMPFVKGWQWWVVAFMYQFLNNFTFKRPFGLMLHCTSHRAFFKKEYDFMNH